MSMEKIMKWVDEMQVDWMNGILSWQRSHEGEKITEEVIRGLFKIQTKKKSSGVVKVKTSKEGCMAARWAYSKGGLYENAKCGRMECVKEDGMGHKLCEECGSSWETVKQHEQGGEVSYGRNKDHPGCAPWFGIYGVDVPPIFVGQEGTYATESNKDKYGKKGKFSATLLFDAVSTLCRGGTGKARHGVWHKPGEPWVKGEMEEDKSEVEEEGLKYVKVNTKGEIGEEGVDYVQVTHGTTPYLYPMYGDHCKAKDYKDAGNAWATINEGEVDFIEDEYETAHDNECCC